MNALLTSSQACEVIQVVNVLTGVTLIYWSHFSSQKYFNLHIDETHIKLLKN